jgi:hypothetical protein
MHETVFVKVPLFDQDPVNRTAKRRPVHFGFEPPSGPRLKKATCNPVACFKSGDSRANPNNFSGPVREGYTSFHWRSIILAAHNNKVTIIKRSRPDPNGYLVISGIGRRPVDECKAIGAAVFLDFVRSH